MKSNIKTRILTTLGLFGTLTLASAAPTIPNPSFEANSFTVGPGYISGNSLITGWSTTDPAHAGLNSAGWPFADNGAIPQGNNVAFIQSAPNSSLSTVISDLTAGQTYKVNFRVNARSGFGGTPNLKVSIDSLNVINTVVTPVGGANPYKSFAFDFTAAAASQTMTLKNDAGGDHTVLVDDFSIAVRDSGWSYAAWNDDASSGVASNRIYTHAYNFGDDPDYLMINGIAFEGFLGASPSRPNQFSTAGLPNFFDRNAINLTGASWQLARDFLWGGALQSITIYGLTVGNAYVATIYSFGYENGARAATFSAGNDRLTVNQDQFGNNNGIRVSYSFTANASSNTLTYVPLQHTHTFHTCGFSVYEVPLEVAPLMVSNLDDSGPGSLRQAIADANASPSFDLIRFDAALSGQTNLLTTGQLTISNSLTIDASTLPTGFNLSGNDNSRVFEVASNAAVTLSSLTIEHGRSDRGGGIFVNSGATLTLSNCILWGNSASSVGGAIENRGMLTIRFSTIASNSASAGGGVFNFNLPDDSNFTTFNLDNSTVAHNSATLGGGIMNLQNSRLRINNSTLSANRAFSAGSGIHNLATLALTNTIVAGNLGFSGFPDYNILTEGDGTIAGVNNLTNFNPVLAPLANYGGRTPTMRPRPGSPAIDAGTNSVTGFLVLDQRGYARRFGARTDIGAVEAQVSLVGNLNDSGPGSLREAIASGLELIGFANNLAGGTLALTNGPIGVNRSLTVDALTSPILISGNHDSRIFIVFPGTSVVLDSLYLTDGNADSGGGILVFAGGSLTLIGTTLYGNTAGNGGGIASSGDVTLINSLIEYNFATNNSGGVENNGGTLRIEGSAIYNNAANYGGGIANYYTGHVTVVESDLRGNSAAAAGGAIFLFDGNLTVVNSTLAENSANYGGGIDSDLGAVTLRNSTLSANSATNAGGGIRNGQGAVLLLNATLAGNLAGVSSGGIDNHSTLALTNTIAAGNTAPANPNLFIAASASLSGVNNLTNGNPLLAPLDDYGGRTASMRPLHGSPAIDAGADSATNLLATDQRGYPRLSGARVDIGAVEAQFAPADDPPELVNPTMFEGALTFDFASAPNADFTVLVSTNLSAWEILGPVVTYVPFLPFAPFPSDYYQFTDPAAGTYPKRFYKVASP